MRNRAIATGSSTWWYWLCCSQTAIGAFFFWQLATSVGTLPTPSEPERETEFQTIHSTLIKWHCVCWSLHLSYNGTPLVRPEACGASVTMSGWQGFRRSSWCSARYEQPFKTGWFLCLSESCRCELCIMIVSATTHYWNPSFNDIGHCTLLLFNYCHLVRGLEIQWN